MRSIKFVFTVAALTLLLAGYLLAASASQINRPDPNVADTIVDDGEPDVTARVARISFISGDAQIRRGDDADWEKLSLNLPIVEGDEITTGSDSRVEIQFDSYTHLRLDENSFLKMTKLVDGGIAASLSQGTASIRLIQFDKDAAYFEVDGPGTTVAIERAGRYRIDAGQNGGDNIRVSVSEDGEARVYTETSGVTVKNGRSARIFIAGPNDGEWDTDNVATFADNFDSWALDRDAIIAKNLAQAHYDEYYDRDIYGAEDLAGYGDWVYTKKYGYVWRPSSSSTNIYADWSPYRYGHWRWMPPYGWTWVNDEPWGWATYHHGRWIYDSGYWAWTPYGYQRYSRSWWSPALVVVSVYDSSICWYPLPYNYGYYNYNHWWNNNAGGGGWNGHNGHNGGGTGGGGGGIGPTPTPTPGPTPGSGDTIAGNIRPKLPPLGSVPPGAVVAVDKTQFGLNVKGNRKPPLSVATSVLTKVPNDSDGAPILPTIKDLRPKMSRDIKTTKPPMADTEATVKTGAAPRKTDAPLDRELQLTRILGNRKPVQKAPDETYVKPSIQDGPRKTGAVDRPEIRPRNPSDTIVKPPSRADSPIKETPRNDEASPRTKPTYVPPPIKEQPRYDEPKQPRTPPRFDPPPVKEQPRNDPPPRRVDPPPQKSEPKKDEPAPIVRKGGDKKDGR